MLWDRAISFVGVVVSEHVVAVVMSERVGECVCGHYTCVMLRCFSARAKAFVIFSSSLQ